MSHTVPIFIDDEYEMKDKDDHNSYGESEHTDEYGRKKKKKGPLQGGSFW